MLNCVEAFFFFPVIPLGSLIALISVAIAYWVDRYVFFRRSCRPPNLSSDLPMKMNEFMSFCLFSLALGQMIVDGQLYGY
jgi:hypothetical protein